MKFVKFSLIALVLAMVGLIASSPAVGGIVNVTTGTTLFFDDFENLGTDVSHGSYPDTTGDFDPTGGGPESFWEIQELDEIRVQVTDHVGTSDPGPASGNNYLRGRRATGDPVGVIMFFPTQTTVDDHLRFEQWMNFEIPTAPKIGHTIAFEGAGGVIAQLVIAFPGPVDPVQISNFTGVFTPIPALEGALVPDKWQKWTIDYHVAAGTFNASIDSAVATDLPANDPGFPDRFFVNLSDDGGGGRVYMDDGVRNPILTPGDFDGDGDVDGADFVAWQTHFPTASGATLAEGDADGDGDVDGADFVVWQTNFPFAPSSSISSVPEPVSVVMFLFGSTFVMYRCRRRS